MKTRVKQPEKPIKPYDRDRFYTILGHRYPSVTTVLAVIDKSGPLMHWAVNEERKAFELAMLEVLTGPHADKPEEILKAVNAAIKGQKAMQRASDKATNIGKAAHAWIEWHLKRVLGKDMGEELVIPEAAQWAVESFKDWEQEVSLEPINVEHTVFSMVHGLAGTLDLYCRVRGVLSVVDFKTSKACYPEYFLQTTAYRVLAAECGMPSEQGIILRLPKIVDDPAFESMIVPEWKDALSDILAAKRLWEWKRKMSGLEIGG